MVWEERILRIIRHAPRNFILPGEPLTLENGFTAFGGAGVHIDGEAHIDPNGRVAAIELGKGLYVPENWKHNDRVYVGGSLLTRAQETDLAIAEGMLIRDHARVGIPEKNQLRKTHTMAPEQKRKIVENGMKFIWNPGHGLTETTFYASNGEMDHGNELFVESQLPESKARFPLGSFRYQATIAMDPNDIRVDETPDKLADDGLLYLVPELVQKDIRIVQGTTHTFNIEAVMTRLLGMPIGKDGNELYANAGGGFDQLGYLEARMAVNTETTEIAPTMEIFRSMPFELKGKRPDYYGSKLMGMGERSTEVLKPYLRD